MLPGEDPFIGRAKRRGTWPDGKVGSTMTIPAEGMTPAEGITPAVATPAVGVTPAVGITPAESITPDAGVVDIENVEIAFEEETAANAHGLPEAKKDTWFT